MTNTPSREEWRRLYEAAAQVKELAPWEWMEETGIFGVKNPETGQLGFVSVMGSLGEHYAVALYQGQEGLYGFWRMQNMGPDAVAEQILEIPQLQASFEDRDQTNPQDREVIKELGLKFRGRQAWPLFRSYRPGYVPWYLEAEEARFLTLALEQLLDIAPRFQQDDALLQAGGEIDYLVRVPKTAGERVSWEDQVQQVPPPEPQSLQLPMDIDLLSRLKQIRPGKQKLEVDFFLFPATIQEHKGERPFYPYMLMVVEASSGMVLGSDLLKVETSLIDLWGSLPLEMVKQLARAGFVPGEIQVRSPLLAQVLQPLADELRFKLKHVKRLPMLDEARGFLAQRF